MPYRDAPREWLRRGEDARTELDRVALEEALARSKAIT
jgi:hypothetical protein